MSQEKFSTQAKGATKDLKEKESKVLYFYFGLSGQTHTLQAIGDKFSITRERVRQIKNNALVKIKASPKMPAVSQKIDAFIKANGGICSEKYILARFIDKEKATDAEINSLKFLIHLIPKISRYKETFELDSCWIKSDYSPQDLAKISDALIKILKKAKDIQAPEQIYKAYQKLPLYQKYPANSRQITSVARATKKIKKLASGKFGLSVWPHINPRNTRDKIHFILCELKKPLHFRKITELIHSHDFEGRKPSAATVHNELIADTRYVLIGKGIYALTEWGFRPGTVADVLREILATIKEGLDQDKLIEEVLKARQISKNTVIMNLQTQAEFIRDKNGVWKLKKNI